MPGCVLHIEGEHFDPRPVMATLSLRPYAVARKGDVTTRGDPPRERIEPAGRCSCEVSTRDGNLADEVDDAIAFLTAHYDDLERLGSAPGVESMILDFGYYSRLGDRFFMHGEYLPPLLLRLAGGLGIGIALSLYQQPSGDSG